MTKTVLNLLPITIRVTYKARFYMLLILFVASGSYLVPGSLKEATVEYKTWMRNSSLAEKGESGAFESRFLMSENSHYDSIIMLQAFDTAAGFKKHLSAIGEYCINNKIELRELSENISLGGGESGSRTICATAKGTFFQLLELGCFIENEATTGRLSSVEFQLTKNRSLKTTELIAIFYIQNCVQPANIKKK